VASLKEVGMRKNLLVILVGALFLGTFLLFQVHPGVWAEEDLSKQVAQILKNQEKILQELQEIRKQLDVIRIRTR